MPLIVIARSACRGVAISTRRTAHQPALESSPSSSRLDTFVNLPQITPSVDLTPEEWIDRLKGLEVEIPRDILDRLTKSVVLSPRIAYADRGGDNFLIFFNFNYVDGIGGTAYFTNHGTEVPLFPDVSLAALLVGIPAGKFLSLDLAVRSEEPDTFFHVLVSTPASTASHVIKGTGMDQHLTFVVDARPAGNYHLHIRNKNIEAETDLPGVSRAQTWFFFRCTILELD